jgi:hypothetical protein
VHLPTTCALHRYQSTFLFAEIAPTSVGLRTPYRETLQYQKILRFTAPHRPRLNNQPTTCLPRLLIVNDGARPRLCCLTLVSPCLCTLESCTTMLLRRERLRPASTNTAMQASVEWLVWPATNRSTADTKPRRLVRDVLLHLPGRLLPQLLLTPPRSQPFACLKCTLQRLQPLQGHHADDLSFLA